jgi:hypothetical protein
MVLPQRFFFLIFTLADFLTTFLAAGFAYCVMPEISITTGVPRQSRGFTFD